MTVTAREIYLNQLASGVTPSPSLIAMVEKEGKVTQEEIDRATSIGGTTAPKTTTLDTKRYNELLQEAVESEGAAPASCPTVNWEVKYFDQETRQYETIVIPAKTGYAAEKIAQTLTGGSFYSANHATETTGGSWTSSRDETRTDRRTGVTTTTSPAAQTAAQVLPESFIGPVPPDLEKQIVEWVNLARGWGATGEDILPAIQQYAQRSGLQVTPEQIQIVIDWQDYSNWQQQNTYMPVANSASEYAINYERWLENMPYYQAGYSQEHLDSWDTYKAYASKYGDLADNAFNTLDEYLTNWDLSQQQLQSWMDEAGSESFGFTDDQRRAYDMYWDYYNEFAPTGTAKPVDIGDFYNNFDYFQSQLIGWQRQQQTGEGIAGLGGTSGTSTGREYWEQPRYPEMSTQWLDEQNQFSSALSRFTESQFPSLQRLFEAQEPRLEPYSSREGAIAEAERREGRFQSWLTSQTPEIEKKYWAQRPSERGEKLWAFSPNVRFTNW